MTQGHDNVEPHVRPASMLGLGLLAAGALALLMAGLLLWWREGDKLFTDGLIAAIVACF
jgi:hypothetical protein